MGLSHDIMEEFKYSWLSAYSTSFYYKYYSGTPHKVMIVGVLLLLVCKELCENRMTRKSLLNLVVGAGLFFLMNNVGSVSVAVMFILIWSARKIDFKRIARFTLVIPIESRGGAARCFG